MAATLPNGAARTPEEKFHTGSQPFHTVSHALRIDAKQGFLAVVQQVRTEMGLSIENMAQNAGCTTSAMSDALAGKDSRNFAGHWLLAQGDAFVARFNDLIEKQLGLTRESIDEREAEHIGRLVQALVHRGFRARSEGVA